MKNAPGSQSNDGAPPSIFPPHIFSHCSVYLLTLIRIFAHIGAYICSHCCIYLLKLLPSIATEICNHICSVDLLMATAAYSIHLLPCPFSVQPRHKAKYTKHWGVVGAFSPPKRLSQIPRRSVHFTAAIEEEQLKMIAALLRCDSSPTRLPPFGVFPRPSM